MTRVVLLDTGPLGLVSTPQATGRAAQCVTWAARLMAAGDIVVIPEIADYEVRRELLRASKSTGVVRLDELKQEFVYATLTTAVMQQAALFWAQLRQQGRPTAPDPALDGDVILAAQALQCMALGSPVIIATTNVSHLSRLTTAQLWDQILPTP